MKRPKMIERWFAFDLPMLRDVYVEIRFMSLEQPHTTSQMQTNLQPFGVLREVLQQKWLDVLSQFNVSAL